MAPVIIYYLAFFHTTLPCPEETAAIKYQKYRKIRINLQSFVLPNS